MADEQTVTRHLTTCEKCYFLLVLLHGSVDAVVLGIVAHRGALQLSIFYNCVTITTVLFVSFD